MKPFSSRCASVARSLAVAAVAACFASSALATWSIVVVNTRTGEVCVASATCLGGDIQKLVPVVVPGHGVAAAQSSVDVSSQNRQLILAGFQANLTPQEILASLQAVDPQFQSRQYGIVDLFHDPATFTGTGAGIAKIGVSGIAGDLRYSIQGNVLTGDNVVIAAQAALLNTDGDLSERCLAAMRAARLYGGDGRCSCSFAHPTACGCPPPHFDKSAWAGFMIVARVGDTLGTCDMSNGCANGQYFMDLDVIGKVFTPDPVRQLEGLYLTWRSGQIGLIDQVHSLVLPSAQTLPADGVSSLTVALRMADIDRNSITHGGANLHVVGVSTPNPVSTVGAIHDHGDGSYDFAITAGLQTGTDFWRVIANENGKDVALQPDIYVRLDPPSSLHCGVDQISASSGGSATFTLDFGAGGSGAKYLVLGSASGSVPGTVFDGEHLPLNVDTFFDFTLHSANGPYLSHTLGNLDASGRAIGDFLPTAGFLTPFVGTPLDFAAITFGSPKHVGGPVVLNVVP